MSKWIYLGSDLRYGNIYLNFTGTELKIITYDVRDRKRKTFIFKNGLAFIYILRLDDLLRKNKTTFSHLWYMYLETCRKIKRWRGLHLLFEKVGIEYESLRKLYTEFLPIVKARVKQVRTRLCTRLRCLFTNKFMKPLGYKKHYFQYLQIIIVNKKRGETDLDVLRKCFTVFHEAKERGIVKAMKYPSRVSKKLGSEFTIRMDLIIDAKTYIEKYRHLFITEVKRILSRIFDDERIVKYYINKLRYGLRSRKYSIQVNYYVSRYARWHNLMEEIVKRVETGEIMDSEQEKNTIINFIVHDYGDEVELVIDFNNYVTSTYTYSQVAIIYDKGKIQLIFFEPIYYSKYRVVVYKVYNYRVFKKVKEYVIDEKEFTEPRPWY